MATKKYGIEFILAANDQMSRVVNTVVNNSLTKFERMSNRMDKIARQTGRIGRGAVAMGVGVGAALAAPTAQAIEFEDAIARLGAVSGIIDPTDEALKRLEQTALELGRTTQFSASQAAEGMQFLAMAGFTAEQNIAALPAVLDLAAASSTDLATSADIASDVMSGFGLQAEDMSRVANALGRTATTANTTVEMLGETMKFVGPIAKQAGVEIEDVAAAAGLLANVGIKGSQAGTTLRSMLLRLSSPTGKAADELKKLGIDTRDSEGNVRSMITIIGELEEATREMGSGQKLASLKTIFGEEPAAGVAELISQGEAGINKQLERMQGAATVEQVAERMSQTTKGQLKQLQSAVEGAAIAFGQVLLPPLITVIEHITDFAGWVTGLISEFPILTKVIGLAAAGFAALALVGGGASLAISGSATVASMAASGLGILTGAVSVVTGAFSRLTAVLLANPIILIVAGIAAAAYLIISNWEEVSEFFVDLWDGITKVFEDFVDFVFSIPKRLFNAGVAIVESIWDGIRGAWRRLVEWFEGAFGDLLGLFNPLNWLAAGRDLMLNLWEGIKSAAASVWSDIKELGSDIVDAINPFSGNTAEMAGELVAEQYQKTLGEIANATPEMINMLPQSAQQQILQAEQSARAQGLQVPTQLSQAAGAIREANNITINSTPNITVGGDMTAEGRANLVGVLQENNEDLARRMQQVLAERERRGF